MPVAADLVIFDCDGVLVNSEGLQARVLSDVLTDHGVESGGLDRAMKFRGGKLANVITTLESEIGRRLPNGVVEEIRARTLVAFEEELRPIDGIVEVLKRILVPYCVASNGPREKMMVSLRCCGILSLFENRIFSAYEVGRWKPDPALFLHAARSMGIEPSRTVVVEDSSLGVQAGVAAGMNVLGFAPSDRATELISAGAAQVFWPMQALAGLLGTSETR
jgi:HAD superfamily hydrolase (TIGR01509 family)